MSSIDKQGSERIVLVIDDDEHVRRTLERVCKLTEGVRPITAANVSDGYKLFCENNIGLVITDLSMPKETGLDLLRRVRSGGSNVPVLVFSGSFTAGTRAMASELGATEILNKPASIDVLMKTIRRLLDIDDSPSQGST